MPRFNLDEFLPYRLAKLADITSRAFEEEYRSRFGIGVAEWRVVAHLSQSSSVSVRDIQRKVTMEKSRVSRACTRLEQAGFVSRKDHPEDRRLIRLELTPEGRNLVDTMAPIAQAFQRDLEQKLGDNALAFDQGIDALLRSKS